MDLGRGGGFEVCGADGAAAAAARPGSSESPSRFGRVSGLGFNGACRSECRDQRREDQLLPCGSSFQTGAETSFVCGEIVRRSGQRNGKVFSFGDFQANELQTSLNSSKHQTMLARVRLPLA